MSSDVLVVDPGELGELLTTLFQQYGIAACCARTGEQAIEVALKEQPGVVIVEYELEDADGLDVADLLRDELQAKVVLTYAHHHLSGEERDSFVARLRTVDASFARPFRSRTLIESVATMLGHQVDPPDVSGEFMAVRDDEEGEPVLLEEEVPEELDYAADDEEESVVFDIDVDPLEDEHAAGHEFSYGGASAEPGDSTSAAAPREAASVPLVEIERERMKTDPRGLSDLWRKVRQSHAAQPEHGEEPPAPPPAPAHPGLVERKGRLTPRVLSDLLDAFHQSQTTGEIWLVRGAAQRVVLLVRGVIVGARTNVASEQLPRLARRRGLVSDEQLKALPAGDADRAFRASKLASDEVLERLLGEQARRVVLGAFAWGDGLYKVSLQGHGKRERHRVVLSIADAISRGILLTETIEALREAAPDEARFAPHPDSSYGLDQISLSVEEARLVVAMDGTKTMGDLATLFPEVPERTQRGLAAGLQRLGLLRFMGHGPAAPRAITFF